MRHRQWSATLLALFASGIIGCLIWTTPVGRQLETDLGLAWAFKLRGPRAAAPEALVVPINNQSANLLSQPPIDRLDQWDRSLFARLIDRLAVAGASVIAFDVAFLEEGNDPGANELLAGAMRRAGNVVLLEWLNQQRPDAPVGSLVVLNLDRLFGPTAKLADAARAMAPWALYKDARTNRFPTYPVIAGSPRPTLPLAALHLFKRNSIDLLWRCSGEKAIAEHRIAYPSVSDEILALRQALLSFSTPLHAPCGEPTIRSLAGLYRADPEIFFNYYGKPGTLVGPPMHVWLATDGAPAPMDIRGKAVFVGVAEYAAVQQTDSFYTVYRSERGNTDISGVELAANAFANLLHRDYLKPVGAATGLLVLLVFGALVGVPSYRLPAGIAVATVQAISVVYAFAALSLFSQHNLWLPVAIPLLIQMPLAVALGWRLRFVQARRLKEAYRGAVEHYVPAHIAESIEQVGHIGTAPEPLHGICMHLDIAGYTGLAERLGSDPAVLKALENEYWELLGAEIYREGGQMLEIAGDGMTCVWASESPSPALQASACRAAIRMLRAVDRFNARHPDIPFHTRLDMHAGRVALGNVGGGGHYTWAVGGDIANTAARLENDLNKLMGTRMVVSRESIDLLRGSKGEEFGLRRLGEFLLRGKSAPITAYELIDLGVSQGGANRSDLAGFGVGLKAFESGDWKKAKMAFEQLLERRPNDGPACFYQRLSGLYLQGLRTPGSLENTGLIDMNPD